MTNYPRALSYLLSLMRHAYWPQQELEEHRNRRLREVVRYAYDNVPFYNSLFRQKGVDPNEIRTPANLNRLPILRKEDVRKNIESSVSKEYRINRLKVMRTSGSTGKPLHFYISQKEDELRKARHLRANISVGQKPRDKWVLITSFLHFGETTKFQRLLGFYVPIPILAFDDVGKQISTIERLKPDLLDGYSSSLFLLAREVAKKGANNIKPRFMIGGAELIGEYSRKLIEKVFAVPLYDQYACDEMERIAWQCKQRQEYHIDADSIIVQFVDKNGEEVQAGERGEIVCTSLSSYAMPFIRYAVGDVGIPSDAQCPCGRTLPLMKVVEGRSDSFIVFAGGRVISPLNFDAAMCLFKFHANIDQYRLIQKKLDHFELLVKLASTNEIEEKTMEAELLKHLWKTLDTIPDKTTFDVRFVENIPLDSTGKLRKVISEIGKNLE